MIDINEILKILPHRYTFLLVDKVVEFEAGKRARGIKNVTINEPFFQGHFPGHPIMPGVLVIEAMAQVGGIFALKSKNLVKKSFFFRGKKKKNLQKPVLPGDRLELTLEVIKQRGA